VATDDEISAKGIGARCARLGGDQHAAEIIPHPEGAASPLAECVKSRVGDCADLKCGGTEGAGLAPSDLLQRQSRNAHDRVREPLGLRGRDGDTIAHRAGSSRGLVTSTIDEIDDERFEWTLRVDDADARRVPRDPPRGVGRPVDWVDDGQKLAPDAAHSRLFAQHRETGAEQYFERRFVGDDIDSILTVDFARSGPVLDLGDRNDDRLNGAFHDGEEIAGSHIRKLPGGLPVRPGADGLGAAEKRARASPTLDAMAVIDVAGYVAELKDHATDHGFHVHDERHFVETYSLRQFWEVDLHPEEGCGGPIDLHLALEVDPRTLLDFEDAVVALPDDEEPPDKWSFPLTFNWGIPPLPNGPDLLRLAIDLAGVGGVELPLEISATDSFGSVTDPPVRRLTIVARHEVSLARVLAGEELLCDTFDRTRAVSRFLLDAVPDWLGE
jgi:hypothetical protein